MLEVKMVDLAAQYAALKADIDAAMQRVMADGRYILGKDVVAFERELAADHGKQHAIGVSSGTDALTAALWAIGVGPGDEVITTAFSFFATAGCIVRLGATPVFADIDASFCLDPASALVRVTSRTKAIVPVHLFGRPATPIIAGVPIVEDGAQAVGSSRLGALVTLSFYPSKNLGAAGDAGMVLADDDAIADRVRLYRTHGQSARNVHAVAGANFRLDTLQAAILRVKRPHLARWTERRRATAARYREMLAKLPLVLPEDVEGHVWNQFAIRTQRRDELRAYLRGRNVETEIYYPVPVHKQPCFGSTIALPEAERATREVLALPVHPQLTDDQIDYVADSVRAFFRPSRAAGT
jgi:dTDP-4-amino-4,6-dideoxygalactose transaminase